MEKIQSHHYIMDENNSQKRKNEVLFETNTDHVFDTNNKKLTMILEQMNQDIADASNKAKTMIINLKGDVTGKAGVADDYSVTMDTVCHKTAQLPLPINSVEFSLSANAIDNLKTVYGGTWVYIGDVQVYNPINDIEGSTFSLYMYKKTSLT